MMINNRVFLLFALCLTAGTLFSQVRDFQSWYEVEIRKDVAGDLRFSLEAEQRFRSNSTRFDRFLVTLDADYELADYLSAGAGFRVLAAADAEGSIRPRYRTHADATGEISVLETDLSLRARLQYGFEDFQYFTEIGGNNLTGRLRLQAQKHIFGTRFTLDGSLEPWVRFDRERGSYLRSMRYAGSVSYALGFLSEIHLRYMFEDEMNRARPARYHILVLGFTRDL